MTLKDIADSVAVNVGIETPTAIASGTDSDALKMVQFTTEAAKEITRRVDWSNLRKTCQIDGTGLNANFSLPSDFMRLTQGMCVAVVGIPVRGGVSPDEWFSLTPSMGTPRYFRLLGSAMSFYPYPAAATPVMVQYQSKSWNGTNGEAWAADTDEPLIPGDLVAKGAVWRWKRHIGADFQDFLAEFEAAMQDFSRFDEGARLP